MNMEQLVQQQRSFFATHATLDYDFRRSALEKLKQQILSHETDILAALKQDLNKSMMEGLMSEVSMVMDELNYMIHHLKRFMKKKAVLPSLSQMPGRCYQMNEPYGVVLILAPWNYPFQLTMEPLIGAIATGNCVILKPSNYAPATSKLISTLLQEIYSCEFVNVVQGGRQENQILLDQRFDFIFFTGGTTIGKLVMEKAAKHLTPVSLELGGKSPCLVEKTADLALAARRIVFGKLLNAGQTCVAPDYLLVDSSIKQDLIQQIFLEVKRQYGETLENDAYPKIINSKHEQRLMGLLENQNILCGGQLKDHRISFTLVDEPQKDSLLMQEEIFGPILPICTVTSLDEAINWIQTHEKPLACYLFTQDNHVKQRVLRECSFGGGCVNDTIIHLATSSMGFGGVGQSGMGSYHGKASYTTFSHQKSIVEKWKWPDLPMRYQPTSKWKEKILRFLFLR